MTKDTKPKPSRCPTCGKPAGPDTAPFCSKRCRMVDLGRWFGESYVIATQLGEPRDPDEDADDGGRS